MRVKNILVLVAIAIGLAAVSFWVGQQAYSWLPVQGSAESILIDDLFSFLVTLGAFIFLGVTLAIIYSIIFHRAGKYDMSDGPPIEGNVALEVVWTAIPILLVLWIAGYSYQVYAQMGIHGLHLHMSMGMESAHAEAIGGTTLPVEKIQVTAKQWAWIFRYPEQNVTSTELHLPVNQRVSLALESEDVIHGFYIPAFRVKQDIIPKHAIDFEFTPIREGKYRLRDSQFSGTYFATMQADVVVESAEEYNQWLAEASTHSPSTAPNQAAFEYSQETNQSFKTGWATIVPTQPPLVNYHE